MTSRSWKTNAYSRIKTLVDRQRLSGADMDLLLDFARQLTMDPYDVIAERDQAGEFYCMLGPSSTYPGTALVAGYRIDDSHCTVEVISYSLVPPRP